MELPIQKLKATAVHPRLLVIAGFQKSGKTTALASLEDNLIIDTEDGSKFIDAMRVDCKTLKDLSELIQALQKSNKRYRFGTIDTASSLEDIALELALLNYKRSPLGRNFVGTPKELLNLPKGAGYGLLRNSFMEIIAWMRPFFETTILVCHIKTSSYQKDGEEIEMVDINLSGQLKTVVAKEADAIGMVFRKKNKTILSFKGGESFLVEARVPHLRGREFDLIVSDENNNLTIDWSPIFPNFNN